MLPYVTKIIFLCKMLLVKWLAEGVLLLMAVFFFSVCHIKIGCGMAFLQGNYFCELTLSLDVHQMQVAFCIF